MRQYYWGTEPPCANRQSPANKEKCAKSALFRSESPIGARFIVAPVAGVTIWYSTLHSFISLSPTSFSYLSLYLYLHLPRHLYLDHSPSLSQPPSLSENENASKKRRRQNLRKNLDRRRPLPVTFASFLTPLFSHCTLPLNTVRKITHVIHSKWYENRPIHL